MIYCDRCGKPIDETMIFTEDIICPVCNNNLGKNNPEMVLTKNGEIMFKG